MNPKFLAAMGALLLTGAVAQADILYLRNSLDSITVGSDGAPARVLSLTRGASDVAFTKSTVNGPIGVLGAADQFTISSAGGLKISWATPPLDAMTISGSIVIKTWGSESSTAANATLTLEVLRLGPSGEVLGIIGAAKRSNPELGTATTSIAWTITATTTSIGYGERIGVRVYGDDAIGVTQASGRTLTFRFNGANPGASGDTSIQISQTLSFATVTPTLTATVSATLTITPTNSPTSSVTPTYTITPTATLTATPTFTTTSTSTGTSTFTPTATPTFTSVFTNTFTTSLSPTAISIMFAPVSSVGPQTIMTPVTGYGISVERASFNYGASSPRFELFGGPGTIISAANVVPLAYNLAASNNDNGLLGSSGSFPTLGLGVNLVLREGTPTAPSAAGGVTVPLVLIQARQIFIGTATLTPTP